MNNDFSQNSWSFIPTEAKVDWYFGAQNASGNRPSHLSLGRQLLVEGFDVALLDGARLPAGWSTSGGILVYGGEIRSLDLLETAAYHTPILGVSLWEEVAGAQVRTGVSVRQEDSRYRLAHAAFNRDFDYFWLAPNLLVKQEWRLDQFAAIQSRVDLGLTYSEGWSGRFAHALLNPRPTDPNQAESFVYRLLAISATEVFSGDLTWDYSDSLQFSLGAQDALYDSNGLNEKGTRIDLTTQISLISGDLLMLTLTRLSSFGGQLSDCGLRFVKNINSQRQLLLDYDVGFFNKSNGISSWVHHARSTFESRITESIKAMVGVEIERNHYFEFDARVMAYATNYF